MPFLAGIVVGAAAAWGLRGFADRQQGLHERRRLLTVLLLELVSHQERLELCRRARFGTSLPVADWTWVRYQLPAHLDRGTLGLLAAYYAAVEAGWNRRFEREGTPDEEALAVAEDLAERNARLQQRVERELAMIQEVRWLGFTFLRDRSLRPFPAQRLSAQGAAVQNAPPQG